MSAVKKIISSSLYRLSPDLWYLMLYRRTARKLPYKNKEKERAFNELLAAGENKSCLQIGVRKKKFGSHWVSVDLFDKSPYIDYNYDIHDLKFEDNKFDVAVCNAVLEHVENPLKAISELTRVLKSGGLIWVEIPFNQHYHPSPTDYWRVTLPGLKLWLKDFQEISAGYFAPSGSAIHNGVYFCGRKSK
ncbi:MAG: class I SAM-dependent methyltransferase [Parcubacteria group bacterium]|nr:MAG: class I SAM-dependent methyltransferase [Parcubacteria group bacterium]